MKERVNMSTQRNSTPQSSTSPEPVDTIHTPILIVIEQRDDVCLVHFKGHFRTGQVDREYLSTKMDEIKTLNCTKALADFRDVPSAGSACLSFIVGLYGITGGRLVLARTQPRVRQVLEIARISTVIPFVDDIESGLAALRGECWAVPRSQDR